MFTYLLFVSYFSIRQTLSLSLFSVNSVNVDVPCPTDLPLPISNFKRQLAHRYILVKEKITIYGYFSLGLLIIVAICILYRRALFTVYLASGHQSLYFYVTLLGNPFDFHPSNFFLITANPPSNDDYDNNKIHTSHSIHTILTLLLGITFCFTKQPIPIPSSLFLRSPILSEKFNKICCWKLERVSMSIYLLLFPSSTI